MNEYTFSKLDIDKNQKAYHAKEITLRQGDKHGCEITATLYDHGERITRTDLTAYFVMALPFGDHYYRDEAEYSAGVVHVTIDESTAGSVPGDTDIAYFELRKGSDLIATTEAIRVHIEPSALADRTPGETYDTEIERVLEEVTTAGENASAAANAANTATSGANAATASANEAAAIANNAADDATAAAAAARGAISANLRFSIDIVEIGGERRMVLADAGEESEG